MEEEFGFEEFEHDVQGPCINACAQCGFKNLELPPIVHYLDQVNRILKSGEEDPSIILFCPRCGFGGVPLHFHGEAERSQFIRSVKAGTQKLLSESVTTRSYLDSLSRPTVQAGHAHSGARKHAATKKPVQHSLKKPARVLGN